MKVLAGDVGGTKAILGVFEPKRRAPLRAATFRSAEHDGDHPRCGWEELRKSAMPKAKHYSVDGKVVGEVELSGPAFGTDCRYAALVAISNARADESTAWNAPSSSVNLTSSNG